MYTIVLAAERAVLVECTVYMLTLKKAVPTQLSDMRRIYLTSYTNFLLVVKIPRMKINQFDAYFHLMLYNMRNECLSKHLLPAPKFKLLI